MLIDVVPAGTLNTGEDLAAFHSKDQRELQKTAVSRASQ